MDEQITRYVHTRSSFGLPYTGYYRGLTIDTSDHMARSPALSGQSWVLLISDRLKNNDYAGKEISRHCISRP